MKEAIELEKSEKIEISIEQQEKKTVKLINSQRHIPGLTLWEYNENTKELNKAEYHKEDLVLDDFSDRVESRVHRKRVHIKEGCQYFQALNRKNALRKISK